MELPHKPHIMQHDHHPLHMYCAETSFLEELYNVHTWPAMGAVAWKHMSCPPGVVLRISVASQQIICNIDYKL